MLKLCLEFLVDIVLCKVASKTSFMLIDILVLVSEFVVVAVLSQWWLFYLSGGQG